jgi:TPR repeat protein
MYEQGSGVELNFRFAVFWYQQSAGQNNPNGLYNLGRMYEGGLGVERNIEEAMKLFQEAADAGHPYASEQLKLYRK